MYDLLLPGHTHGGKYWQIWGKLFGRGMSFLCKIFMWANHKCVHINVLKKHSCFVYYFGIYAAANWSMWPRISTHTTPHGRSPAPRPPHSPKNRESVGLACPPLTPYPLSRAYITLYISKPFVAQRVGARNYISNHLSPRGLEACRPALFGVLGGLLRLMGAWWCSRQKALTKKRKMDENNAGADEVMKRDPGRAEPKSRRPRPMKL